MTRLPDVYVPDRLGAAVRSLVVQRGTTYAALIRQALRRELTHPPEAPADPDPEREIAVALLEQILDRLDRLDQQSCPVCRTPRRRDRTEDAMAHAQCDQIIAHLDKDSETVS